MAADLGDFFPQDHEYQRKVFDSAKELIGHIRAQDALNPLSGANLPNADQQGTRADGSPKIQWTQTAGANGGGALRLGDKFNLGMPVRIAATDFQATPEMPADYVQHEVSDILDGPGNQVAIRSRDMTPEEIAHKQTSLESQNDHLRELGLPEEPIPPVPASVALRFGDSTTAVRPQSGLEAEKAPNLADSTLSWLEQKAEAARQRIMNWQGQPSADPLEVGIDSNFFDHAVIGADHLARGAVNHGDWRSAMLAEPGGAEPPKDVSHYLRRVWGVSKEMLRHVASQDAAATIANRQPQGDSFKEPFQGTAANKKVEWRDNANGVVRTLPEAIALAKEFDVDIPRDIQFIVQDEVKQGRAYASYGPGLDRLGHKKVFWKDFYTKGKIQVAIAREVFQTDEGIVAVIAHEMSELNDLRRLFAAHYGWMSAERFHRLVNADDGPLHLKAWDIGDEKALQVRESKSRDNR